METRVETRVRYIYEDDRKCHVFVARDPYDGHLLSPDEVAVDFWLEANCISWIETRVVTESDWDVFEEQPLAGYDQEVSLANQKFFEEETSRAMSILKRNRYNTVTGEWYGPDPEPAPVFCKHCQKRLTCIDISGQTVWYHIFGGLSTCRKKFKTETAAEPE